MCLPKIPHFLWAVAPVTDMAKLDYGIYRIHFLLWDEKIHPHTNLIYFSIYI